MYSIYITETDDRLDSGIIFPNSKFEAFLIQRFIKTVRLGHQGAEMYRVYTRDDGIILMAHRTQQTGLHLQMFIYYKYTKQQTDL